MKKSSAIAFSVLLILFLSIPGFTGEVLAGKDPAEILNKDIDPAPVLALADQYIAEFEPGLTGDDFLAVNKLKHLLEQASRTPAQLDKTIEEMVNTITVGLAGGRDLGALLTGAAYTVKYDPHSPRAVNAMAAILHTGERMEQAVQVLEYNLELAPFSTLAMLNLASAYLDAEEDDKAREMAERVLRTDDENRQAYKLLAAYWFKMKRDDKVIECLMKAAEFGGVVRRKGRDQAKQVREDEVRPEDSLDQMQAKTENLKDMVPLTTADIIEKEFPDAARQIREKFGRLIDREVMKMPKIPQFNSVDNKGFTENEPLVAEWAKVFVLRHGEFLNREKFKANIEETDSDAVADRKGREAGLAYAGKSMSDAKQMLQGMKNLNIPGVSQAELDEAMAEMDQAASEAGIVLTEEPVDPDTPPGFDSGSIFAQANYSNYLVISRSHETYIHKFFQKMRGEVANIIQVYSSKAMAESLRHAQAMKEIEESEGDTEIPRLREELRYKRAMNTLGDTYYKSWAGLYFPQYARKIKPMLDNYWYVSTLYIKNMNDPKVMEREYLRVKDFYMTHAMEAGTGILNGTTFVYLGPTDEEEEALRQAQKASEEEAVAKGPQFLQDFDKPKDDWVKWIEDHLSLEVGTPVLGFKITARTIEFNAYVPGMIAGVKWDMVDNKVQTNWGYGLKAELGVKFMGLDAKLSAQSDFISKVCEFDFDNNGYKESVTPPKTEVNGSFGPVSAGVEAQLDAQLTPKVFVKGSLGNMLKASDQIQVY